MKILSDISENEMISKFLRAEIHSPRFSKGITNQLISGRKDKRIIEHPNLNDQEENKYRRKVLREYRGYESNSFLFDSFPNDIKWKRVILEKKDFSRIKYINYDYWIVLSGGTRFVSDGAKNVLRGVEACNKSNENFWKVTKALEDGTEFEEAILVSKDINEKIVILEGHIRLTSFLIQPELIPKGLTAIIGTSENMDNWGLF